MSFEKYGLSPELLNGLADVRLEKPTSLQEKMLPVVLEGRHVLVKTYSDDDFAFLIPALQKITDIGEVSGTQVLILTPTIERAKKIDEQIWALGYHAQIGSALMVMKGDKAAQEKALLDGAPVIVANPGRCIEILERNNFRIKDLKLIVIDEAHEMQQYNLVNRVKDILRFVDCEPQTVILSNEKNTATKQLVKLALKNPEMIGFEAHEHLVADVPGEIKVEESPVEMNLNAIEDKLKKSSVSVVLKKDIDLSVESEINDDKITVKSKKYALDQKDGYIKVPPRMKISTLMAHLEESDAKHVVIFTASSRTSDRLFKIIRKKGWGVVSLSDDLNEATFSERVERYKKYDMRVLLIGGIHANAIDCSEMDELINYDVPSEIEEYKSRRAQVEQGIVSCMISLVSKMDADMIETIKTELNYDLTELPFPKEVKKKGKGSESQNNRTKNPRTKTDERISKSRNKRPPKKSKKKKNSHSLPRPTYDGLSGGRDGNGSETGLFGWVKKLFK